MGRDPGPRPVPEARRVLELRRASPEVKVTRVAQGVPIGGALDVLDDGTLAAALRARRPS